MMKIFALLSLFLAAVSATGEDFYGDDFYSPAPPTFAPTVQVSKIVSFFSNITLSNVVLSSPTDELDSASQQSIIDTNAQLMDVDPNSVKFVSVLSTTDELLNQGAMKLADSAYQVVVQTYFSIPLSSTIYTTASDAYLAYTTSLSNTTKYTITLNNVASLNTASQLAAAVCSAVENSDDIVIPVPADDDEENEDDDHEKDEDDDDDDNSGLSDGAIAGIVIGSVVGFLVLAFIVAYFVRAPSSENASPLMGTKDERDGLTHL